MTAPGLTVARHATTNWLLVYGSLIVLAEAVLVLFNATVGVVLQAAILIVVVSHSAFARVPRDPALPVLALVPLIRLLSIAMPIPAVPPITIHALVGAPALLGAILSARAIGVTRAELGLERPRSFSESALMALIGLPLGLVARSVGLAPVVTGDVHPLLAIAVIVIFVVLLEELVFRGLLQRVATTRSGLPGIIAVNVLYAGMYVGSGAPMAVLFMGVTGTLFGSIVRRSGSLWAVLAAHLLMRLVIQF